MDKKETTKREGTVYEVGYLIVPTVSPDHIGKEVEAIKAVLAQNGASVISEEAPKLKSLYYKMLKVVGPVRNKFDTGYFGWLKFTALGDKALEIDKAFAKNEKVLRYLLIKTVAENTIYGTKLGGQGESSERDGVVIAPESAKGEVNQEELDKSIDKLID